MNWFTGRKPSPSLIEKFTVVELEKPTPLEESSDSISAVDSLRLHPGFNWLCRKLSIQASKLKSEIQGTRQDRLEDYYFLQSGIFWCNWLQSQVDFAHSRYLSMRAATPEEDSFLQSLSQSIEVVG